MNAIEQKMITKAVVMAYQNPGSTYLARLLKQFTPEMRREFAELLESKSRAALNNANGREVRENRQLVRNVTNGPAKIRGTW